MSVVKSTYKFVFYPLSLLLMVITLLIIIQPSEQYRIFTNNAVEITLGILGFGILCLLLQWHRLMFVSYACVGILSLFLKSSTNPAPVYATPIGNEDMVVVHVNTSSYDGGTYEDLTDLLLSTNADLISIQEINPISDAIFKEKLSDTFPYISTISSIGFNGLGVFSRQPFINVDTFNHGDIPNLTGLIEPKVKDDKPIRFISTYTNPTFGTDKAYEELKDHFDAIIEMVQDSSGAKLAFGTYNTVAWSSEMKYFTGELGLQNSRRSVSPFSGTSFEHIFHSRDMECVDFGGLYDTLGTKIGLKVKLQQIKASTEDDKYPNEKPTQ